MEAMKKLQTISKPDILKKEPNIAVEVFLSLVKRFLVFVIINNIIWAGIFTYYVHKSVGDTTAEMWQEGHNNNQSITNG